MIDAARDARLLAEHAFTLSPAELALCENQPAPAEGIVTLASLAERRLAGEPVARLIGEKHFFGLSFALGPETLIPRPETELLVELAIARLKDKPAPIFVDLGTGTGCIAIALLANLPAARGFATDQSAGALQVAADNARRHDVADRLELMAGNWLEPLPQGLKFDAILANPPYIATVEIQTLAREVRDFDPLAALDGGNDGLACFRAIIPAAAQRLADGGSILLETGATQTEAVAGLLATAHFQSISIHNDLAGLPRAVMARFGVKDHS